MSVVSWPPTDALTVLACTLWMEARGDGEEGMHAVANVVMTRANHPCWWGNGVVGVCLKPYQISSWNIGSTQIPLVREAISNDDAIYALAVNIAGQAIAGNLPDITGGADTYYAVSMAEPPAYDTPARFRVQIGRQRFYRVQLPLATASAVSSASTAETA